MNYTRDSVSTLWSTHPITHPFWLPSCAITPFLSYPSLPWISGPFFLLGNPAILPDLHLTMKRQVIRLSSSALSISRVRHTHIYTHTHTLKQQLYHIKASQLSRWIRWQLRRISTEMASVGDQFQFSDSFLSSTCWECKPRWSRGLGFITSAATVWVRKS